MHDIDQEPAQLLREAIDGRGGYTTTAVLVLARWTAVLLEAEPGGSASLDEGVDTSHLTRSPSAAYLDNLLSFAAGLSYPLVLADPLRAMLDPGRLPDGTHHKYLLAHALANNQYGQSLKEVWEAMLTEPGHPALGHNRFVAQNGLAGMKPPVII